MEKARYRRSKSVSGSIEGVPQILNYKAVARISSDSTSYIHGNTREDKYMLVPRQRSLGQANVRVRKKFVYAELKSKRRSQSAISRLVGLNGLPSLRLVPKQKHLTDREVYDGRSYVRDQYNLKNVYEDLEAPFVANRPSSRWSASSMPTKHEMSLMKQKLKDMRETDETTLDLFYTNKNSSKEFVKRPDSCSMDYVRGQKFESFSSRDRRLTVLRSSDYAKYGGSFREGKSCVSTLNEWRTGTHVQRKDGLLLEPYYNQRAHISGSSSKIQFFEQNRRIVVLSPTTVNTENAYESDSSDNSHDEVPIFGSINEYTDNRVLGAILRGRKDSSHMQLKRSVSKEVREIGREITRPVRSSYYETMDAKYYRFKGHYPYDAQRSNCDGDLEITKVPATYEKWCEHRSSGLSEWATNAEAKKKLVERWRTTHKYQDLEIVKTTRTLGEMLALSGGEAKSRHMNMSLGKTGDDPSRIRSKDGWKDENNLGLSTSRPPIHHVGGRSRRRGTYNDILSEKNYSMRNNLIHCFKRKFTVGKSSRKIKILPQDSKCRRKKSPPLKHVHVCERSSSPEVSFEIQLETNLKRLSEQKFEFRMSVKDDASEGPVSEVITSGEPLSSESSQSLQEQSTDNDKSAAYEQRGNSFQVRTSLSLKKGDLYYILEN